MPCEDSKSTRPARACKINRRGIWLSGLCAAFALIGIGANAYAQEWRPLTRPVTGATILPEIADDRQGNLWVTYPDFELSYHPGTVRKLTPGVGFRNREWTLVGARGSASVANDWWPNLAFNQRGEIFRASYDYRIGAPQNAAPLLNVRQYNPRFDRWDLMQPFPQSYSEAHFSDLEVDPLGQPVIGFRDGHDGIHQWPYGAVSVLRFERNASGGYEPMFLGGQGFSQELFPDTNTPRSVSWFNALEVGSDGQIWTAWKEHALPIGPVPAVAAFLEREQSWELVDFAGLLNTTRSGDNLNLAVDPNGVPYLVTFEWLFLRVMRLSGGARDGVWTQVGDVVGFGHAPCYTPGTGYRVNTAFAIDPDGTPYVAYRAANFGCRIVVQRYRQGAWQVVGKPGFTPSRGQDDQISFAFQGSVPVVCFRHSVPTTEAPTSQTVEVWSFQ